MILQQGLENAAAALKEVSRQDVSDAACEESLTDTYTQAVALIADCRASLAEIEEELRETMARWGIWHRERVAEIEALGLSRGGLRSAAPSAATLSVATLSAATPSAATPSAAALSAAALSVAAPRAIGGKPAKRK